jgi:hypothetical protein
MPRAETKRKQFYAGALVATSLSEVATCKLLHRFGQTATAFWYR